MVPYKWDSAIDRWTREEDTFWVQCKCDDGLTLLNIPTRTSENSHFRDKIDGLFKGLRRS
jgi:hypothetical protein